MCGICGYAGSLVSERNDSPEIIRNMLHSLYFRGPDDENFFRNSNVVLGIRRLAVIDPHGGRQPFTSEDGKVVIVYNGEVYNHPQLRSELTKSGYTFSSNSDTEVVLKAYLAYGDEFVNHLNGMFAIAIWDNRKNRLLLARDHFGQKPLYYAIHKDSLLFASDLRTVLKHPAFEPDIDRTSLANYLTLRHVPCPDTIVQNIKQLPPAALLIRKEDGDITLSRYWSPVWRPDPKITISKAVEEFTRIWSDVVKRHLISDMPLGAFLSGGIDSSLIVAEMMRLAGSAKTFSISFTDKNFDETPYALEVAKICSSDHTVIPFHDFSLLNLLEEAVRAYDQPFSDPAMFPTLILSKETSRHVTVSLTGDGGDELFCGYQRYYSTLLSRYISLLPLSVRNVVIHALNQLATAIPNTIAFRRIVNAASRRIDIIHPDVRIEYINQFQIYKESELHKILSFKSEGGINKIENKSGHGLLSDMLLFDLLNWLPNQMLYKVDRASMAYSLETRLPFLDMAIVDLALRIPAETHISLFSLKRVLRRAALQIFPKKLINRRKHGFLVPVDHWLRKESQLVEDILYSGLDRNKDLLCKQSVKLLWADHKCGKENYGERLLAIIMFFCWQQANKSKI